MVIQPSLASANYSLLHIETDDPLPLSLNKMYCFIPILLCTSYNVNVWVNDYYSHHPTFPIPITRFFPTRINGEHQKKNSTISTMSNLYTVASPTKTNNIFTPISDPM